MGPRFERHQPRLAPDTGTPGGAIPESRERTRNLEGLLAGKVVVVTGSTRGIGKAIALEAAYEGASAVITNSTGGNPNSAIETRDALEQIGTQTLWLPGDVADREFQGKLMKDLKDKVGRVDVLINNAGIIRDNMFVKMTDGEWEEVIRTNLSPTFYLTRDAYNEGLFPRRGGAAVVNMLSISGLFGNPGQENYAAAKSGLVGLTTSLAKDLGRRNIRVNGVAPGFVKTEMTKDAQDDPDIVEAMQRLTPLGRLAEPEDIASVVVFLASQKASFVTGQVWTVDGGLGGAMAGIPELTREIKKTKKLAAAGKPTE